MTYWTGNSQGDPRTANVTINTAFEAITLTALNWTSDPPKRDGLYFIRLNKVYMQHAERETEAVRVFHPNEDTITIMLLGDDYSQDPYAYDPPLVSAWLGPLPEPWEPE